MRLLRPAALAASILVVASCHLAAQTPPQGLTISNYQMVSEQRVSVTESYVTYRADIVNTSGKAWDVLTATATSLVPSISVVPGQANLHFANIPASGRATSIDTFTILVDRSVVFSFSNLQWSFLAPWANAGPSQTATLGSTVTLDGSGSSNPSGFGTLTYQWFFVSRPAGTSAAMRNFNGVTANFDVDVPGVYVVALTVSNGFGSDTSQTTVSTINSPPVANAGPSQTVPLNSTVVLNGSGSSDVDGDTLSYSWTLITRPTGSIAALSGASTVAPSFVADKKGLYVAQLVVNDGKVSSVPATVNITTENTRPVANAGENQTVDLGSLVQLNGSGSTDVDGDPLTFRWSLLSVPAGSVAVLSSTSAVNPSFTADKVGTYVAQLIVNDGQIDSDPDTVTISTNNVQPPTANAGPNQTVVHGSVVNLSGSGTDPQSLPLTYLWSLITRPAGSVAVLSATNVANPTFAADRPGTYVAQLIVNNGYLNSTPATVTITTTNTAPVANAGPNQTVTVGLTVTLNGSNSSDADNDPITFAWSLTSRPSGSNAVLSGANTAWPTFFADVAGTYVAQLIVSDGFASSEPATVTVTGNAMTISLTPDPLYLFNAPGTLTVGIGAPAPAGGLTVTLANLNPAVATLPASIFIPEGASGANVTVTPVSIGSTMVLASASGYQPGTGNINVGTPGITLQLASPTIGLTRTVDGTLTLSGPAPVTGATITLSAAPAGRVTIQPSTIGIQAGATTAAFTVSGVSLGPVTITATSPGYSDGLIAAEVRSLGAILLGSGVILAPGQSAPLAVNLVTPAPAGGVTIALSSSDTSKVTVSGSVTIPEGAIEPVSPAQVTGVDFGSAVITASAAGFIGDSKAVEVKSSLSFVPSIVTIGAGAIQNLTLTLAAPAVNSGLEVSLESSNTGVVTVPPSVIIPAGAVSATVPVTALASGTATITARAALTQIVPATASVTVTSSGTIILPNVSLNVGQSTPFPITLSAPAPAGGVSVTLITSDAGVVVPSPSVVSIAAGATTPSTQPQVSGVSWGSATITASAPGFGSANRVVQVSGPMTFSPAELSVAVGQAKNLTLNLSAAAPNGGLVVNLSATPTGIATIPPTVAIPAGGTSATVPVTGAAQGNTAIRATAAGFSDATAQVTVAAASEIILPANVVVAPGDSVAFPVTLASPATVPVIISLASSDISKATLSTSSVLIDTGQTAPAATPRVNGISTGSAIITATGNGFAPANTTVTVGTALGFQPATLEVVGTETRQLTVTLSGPAPAGGLTVNLTSSNTAAATVTPTAVILAGASSVNVGVTGVAPGSTVITASATGASSATANVTVVQQGTISIPVNLNVPLDGNVDFPVVLSKPAPNGGVTVNLSSSDTGKLTVSPASVFIPAGATQPAAQPQVHGVNVGSATVAASATGYTTATQTVQVHATFVWIPSSITVAAGSSQNVGLRLTVSAPAAGLTATITSQNPDIAWAQNSISFHPDGSTFTQVMITVHGVAPGTATIKASGINIPEVTLNVTVTGPLTVTTPSLSPGQVGTPYSVVLGAAGGVQPYTWALTAGTLPDGLSLNAATGVISGTPATPVNNTPLTFTVTDSSSPAQTASKDFTLTITAASSLQITTASLPDGQQGVAYSHTLTAGGGTTPYTWALTSGTLPAGLSLNPATGEISGTPTAAVAGAALTFRVTDSASPAQTATKSLSLTIAPPGLAITTTSLPAGEVGAAYSTTLSATGGTTPYTWSLTAGTLPSGLTLNPSTGAIGGTPTAAVANTPLTFAVTDTASPAQTVSKSFTLTIASSAARIVLPANVIVAPGESVFFPVTLSSPAAAPLLISLTSSDASKVTLSTSTLFVDVGQTNPNATPRVNGISAGSATITATAVGYAPVSQTVTVGSGLSFVPNTLEIVGAVTKQLTLMLSAPAPDGGLAVNLGSSNTAAATVPASVTIGAGASSTSVPVTGVKPGAAVITATATDMLPATANVTVVEAGTISIPANVSVPLAATVAFPVTLSKPAPAAGLTVTLASSDTAKVTISPTSVFIAAGATAPATQPQVHGVNVGAATITATAPGYSPASQTVQVHATLVWLPSSVTVTAGESLNVILKLTVSAPMAGLTATIVSSDPGIAWAQNSVDFNPDGSEFTQVVIPVHGVMAGVTTIKASGINIPEVTLNVTVTGPLAITTPSLSPGVTGTAYSAMLQAGGGLPPYTWALTAGTLPAGLALNASTGAITGTPTATVNNAPLTFTVTDSGSPAQSNAKTFALTITAPPLTITTASLPIGSQHVAYSHTLEATGGTQPYKWSLRSGTLPAGLTLDAATGEIAGTPTVSVIDSPLTFMVADSSDPGDTATKSLTLTIVSVPVVTTTALPDGEVGAAYSAALAAAGGAPPYTWALTSGTLPGGLSLNTTTGAIAGTPAATVSNTPLTFTATDSSTPAQTATKSLTLTIKPPPLTITTTALPDGQVGTSYSYALAATGGVPSYTWALTSGTLPAGLTLNASNGVIGGSPTAYGTASLTFRATDSASPAVSVSKTFELKIAPAPLVITTASLNNGQQDVFYDQTLDATGGVGAYTWALTAGTLPAGLTLNAATGRISGTPTVTAINVSLTIRVTDSASPAVSTSKNFTLTIAPPGLAITTTSLPNGRVGDAYSATLAAAGGVPGYTWATTAGTLPAGLSLNTSTGVISGTPTAAATTAALTFRVTDSSSPAQSVTANLTLTITLVITNASLPDGKVGTPYSATLAATGGKPPFTWALTSGTLPAGLSLNTSTGVISGTPTAAVSGLSLTFRVTDSGSPAQAVAKTLALTIAQPLTITTTSLPDGKVGTAYSATLAATGGTGARTWGLTSGTLPAGLTLNTTTGAITGTPSAPVASVSLTFTVTDSGVPAQTATKVLTLRIGDILAITTTSLPDGKVGTAYSATLAATGGITPRTWALTSGTLPAGLSLNASTGVISGTPSAPVASVSLTFTVTDSSSPAAQTAAKTLSLRIADALAVTTTSLPDGKVGTPYSQTLAASGGTGTRTWALTNGTLPAGLSLNASTGAIAGTPTAAAAAVSLTFTVTDSGNPVQTATKTLSLTIAQPLSVTTASLPNGQVGLAYEQTLAATGGTAPLTWALTTGTLPAGLSLNATTGVISGTPTTAVASVSLTFTVTDSGNPAQTAPKTLTLKIVPPPPAITTTSLPDGQVEVAYSQALAATGGTTPLSWALTAGTLPAGLTLNSTTGVISGTPTAAATAVALTFTVTDSETPARTASKDLTLTVKPKPPSITTSLLFAGKVGVPYELQMSATDGTLPYTWAITSGALPPGMTFSAAGLLSGTPTAPTDPNVSLTFRVTDSGSPAQSATRTLSLTILPDDLAILTEALPNGTVGIAYAAGLQAKGGRTPYTWSIVSGELPPGLTLDGPTGIISGTPLEPRSVSITFKVQDSSNVPQSVTKAIPIVVSYTEPPPAAAINLTSASVGQNLQATIVVSLTQPVGAGGVNLSITSSNPDLVKLASRIGDPGVSPLVVPLTQGTSEIFIYAQGFASSGSVTLTATATGYANGTATVTTSPSGFILEGPNGMGASFVVNQGQLTTLTVRPARLDASLNFVQAQEVRAGYLASVTLENSNPLIGSLSPPSVTFMGGDSSATAQFTATNQGTGTIAAVPPPGFSTPAGSANALTATVLPPGLVACNITAGYKLQAPCTIQIDGAAASDLDVVLQSSDAGKLLLSKTPGDAGFSSITLKIAAGHNSSQEFYVQALAKTGTATYSVTAAGFGSVNGTVTFAPSGFVMKSPFGLGADFFTTSGSPNSNIEVYSARLNASMQYVEAQAIAGGLSISANVTSSNTGVGTITTSPLTFNGGSLLQVTQFDPVASGSTTLAVSGPADFNTPAQYASLVATVRSPNLACQGDLVVGRNLQQIGSVLLGEAAPPGGLAITITSNSASMRVASSETGAGANSVIVNVPAGSTIGYFWVHGLASSGTASFSCSASGYTTDTRQVTLLPSGIVVAGLFGFGWPHWVSLAGGPSTLTVSTAVLDPATSAYVMKQPLAGGTSVSISLTNSTPGTGTVTTPVTITGGTENVAATFTPLAVGTTTISVAQPANFTQPSNYTSVAVQVNP